MISKMNASSDASNKNILCSIVREWWGLDEPSTDRVCSAIWNPPTFAGVPTLGHDQRYWLPASINANTDAGYNNYREILSGYSLTLESILNFDEFEELSRYETYKSGLYQGQKLFKLLLKWGIPEESIQHVTTSRSVDNLWWCLSKNPVDFLMMSTGQSFGSCMGLNSDYSGAMYLGMPQIWIDPWKYILFLSKGKVSNYMLKGHNLRYFKMQSRSIAILCPNNTLGTVRWFPNKPMEPVDKHGNMLDFAGLDILESGANWHSVEDRPAALLSRDLWFDKKRIECQPYNDCYCTTVGYEYGSSSGSRMSLRWFQGFEKWTGLSAQHYIGTCEGCNESIYEDDEYHTVDNNYVCEACRDEYYCRCEICDELHLQDNSFWHNNYRYCESCSEEYFTSCNNCGNPLHNDDSIMVDEKPWCQRCVDRRATYCDHCGEHTAEETTESAEGNTLCIRCVDQHEECDHCIKPSNTLQNVIINTDGDLAEWCESCRASEILECSICKEMFNISTLYLVEDECFEDQLACSHCVDTINRRKAITEAIS